ncbi:MAG: hypothetical protein ACJAVI_005727 [Candidatus Azotimanducaceae bacterium]|jgi:hypothetical protein
MLSVIGIGDHLLETAMMETWAVFGVDLSLFSTSLVFVYAMSKLKKYGQLPVELSLGETSPVRLTGKAD